MDIDLLTGRYDAAGAQDRKEAEWPPHPARLFCALVAATRQDADRSALRWLESQPAPTVLAAAEHRPQVRSSYVVTNSTEKKGGNLSHPGRTNGLRERTHSVPTTARCRMVWPDAPITADLVETLDRLARRIPYLGRSTGIATVTARALADGDPFEAAEDGLETYLPCGRAEAQASLRVPYPGYLEELEGLHEAGMPAWEASRSKGYRRATTVAAPKEQAAPSAYSDIVILRFTRVRPGGRMTTVFTEALRSRVMSVAPDPLPAALHGHGADGLPHVAFLGLPDVEHDHADGHLIGLAVAVPQLPAEQRRAIVQGVLGGRDENGCLRLRVPRVGQVELSYEPGLVRPWAARPERWRKGGRRWVSATPMVLDHYPRRGDIEAEVLRSCLIAGLPAPREIEISTQPMISGGVRMIPRDLPATVKGRLFRHVALTFDTPVAGPMLIGAGRYLGSGLFVAVSQDRQVA
jgi:CRISPR-associated protein Csb2